MAPDMSDPAMAAAMERDIRTRLFVALVLTIPTVLYSPLGQQFLGLTLPKPIPANWIMLLLTTPVVFWCGWVFIGGAFGALRARTLDMSVLIATGVLATYLASIVLMVVGDGEGFFEAAAMLVTFVLFGHWIEMKSRKGTSDSLRALFDLVPPTATVRRDGQEVAIPTAAIVVGDTVVLRPGDKVPTDGEVLTGRTSIDEALVTGESLPVEKGPGDPVVGGAINRNGAITFRATRVGGDTALAQIVALVRRAQSSKAPGQFLSEDSQHPHGLANSSGRVGRYLMHHAYAEQTVIFPEPVDGFVGAYGAPLFSQEFYETVAERGFVWVAASRSTPVICRRMGLRLPDPARRAG